MPLAERTIVTWLSRNPNCTLDQLCEGISSTSEEVLPMLIQLVEAHHQNSAETEGETVYSVVYSARKPVALTVFRTSYGKKLDLNPGK